MTQPIRNFPAHQQQSVARRRINAGGTGLGYWGAYDGRRFLPEYNKFLRPVEEKSEKGEAK